MFYEIFHNISIGLMIIVATFLWHAFSLDILFRIVHRFLPYTTPGHQLRHISRVIILAMTTVGVICVHSVEIWGWALAYLQLHISTIKNLETALYFSTVSMSTVGYGDVVLPPDWRLMGSMQAASGMILFGWSTAFIFEVLAITYNRFTSRTNVIPRVQPPHDGL